MFLIQNLTLSLTDKKLDDDSSSTLDFHEYNSRGVLDLLGIETDEGGDYILYMDTNECCTIYNRIRLF